MAAVVAAGHSMDGRRSCPRVACNNRGLNGGSIPLWFDRRGSTNRSASQPQPGHINGLERLGDVISGTGSERRRGLEEMASTSTSNNVRQGTFNAPSFMGVVESASTAAGLDQANKQPENYNTQMTQGEAGRLSATIDIISHASSFGPTNASILGPERPPIQPKVVSLILANRFVEMSDLLHENL